MIYTIDDPNAVTKLGNALVDMLDGDEVVVRTVVMAELAERGAKRLDKLVYITIKDEV